MSWERASRNSFTGFEVFEILRRLESGWNRCCYYYRFGINIKEGKKLMRDEHDKSKVCTRCSVAYYINSRMASKLLLQLFFIFCLHCPEVVHLCAAEWNWAQIDGNNSQLNEGLNVYEGSRDKHTQTHTPSKCIMHSNTQSPQIPIGISNCDRAHSGNTINGHILISCVYFSDNDRDGSISCAHITISVIYE